MGIAGACEPERACMFPEGALRGSQEGRTWGERHGGRGTGGRGATAALVARELAALGAMISVELAAKFERLLGRASRTRNSQYLRKRLAWEIQARIEALGKESPSGWRDDLAGLPSNGRQAAGGSCADTGASNASRRDRPDPDERGSRTPRHGPRP